MHSIGLFIYPFNWDFFTETETIHEENTTFVYFHIGPFLLSLGAPTT